MSTPFSFKPPESIQRPIGRAIADYSMIKPGDRVLVSVSGGKDSLSLLHILTYMKRQTSVKFELGAITVDPQTDGYDPSPLKGFISDLGIKYYYQSQPITQRAVEHHANQSHCSFCARMKRNIMYATARRENYNVLALAQHLDDLAESFLLSAFHGGQLRTMKAHYPNEQGDLRIVRPLIYLREKQMARYANDAKLPVIEEHCPTCANMPNHRQQVKNLLLEEERRNKDLFKNLLATIKPLLDQDYYIRNSDAKNM